MKKSSFLILSYNKKNKKQYKSNFYFEFFQYKFGEFSEQNNLVIKLLDEFLVR